MKPTHTHVRTNTQRVEGVNGVQKWKTLARQSLADGSFVEDRKRQDTLGTLARRPPSTINGDNDGWVATPRAHWIYTVPYIYIVYLSIHTLIRANATKEVIYAALTMTLAFT